MPIGASREKLTIAVGLSIALKTATKCSRSISIQAFNSLLLQKKQKRLYRYNLFENILYICNM